MSATEDEPYGKHTLRFQKASSGWKGVVVGRAKEPREGPTKEVVRADLRRLADAAHPQFIGYEGAIDKFRRIFPEGFKDREYTEVRERNEKAEAARILSALEPDEAAQELGGRAADVARRAYKAITFQLIAWQELDRASTMLASSDGPAFVAASARFCLDPTRTTLATLRTIAGRHDAASWTVITYLPWLWRPEAHMFLKPQPTRRFAERVGHRFQHLDLKADPFAAYSSLLDLAAEIRHRTSALGCQDNIDAQGFIWVTEKYDLMKDMRR